jgi:hypothetical protein
MVRRSLSKAKTIDSKFPIRVRVSYSRTALPGLFQAIERWGIENLGRGRVATHTSSMTGVEECTLYFRTLPEAELCLEDFPELELRDYVSQTNLEKEGKDLGVIGDIRRDSR